MFQKAKCRFEGERTMCLTMADTIVAEGKTSEITSYLKDVFENRFHVPVDVEIDYEEVGESKYRCDQGKESEAAGTACHGRGGKSKRNGRRIKEESGKSRRCR